MRIGFDFPGYRAAEIEGAQLAIQSEFARRFPNSSLASLTLTSRAPAGWVQFELQARTIAGHAKTFSGIWDQSAGSISFREA